MPLYIESNRETAFEGINHELRSSRAVGMPKAFKDRVNKRKGRSVPRWRKRKPERGLPGKIQRRGRVRVGTPRGHIVLPTRCPCHPHALRSTLSVNPLGVETALRSTLSVLGGDLHFSRGVFPQHRRSDSGGARGRSAPRWGRNDPPGPSVDPLGADIPGRRVEEVSRMEHEMSEASGNPRQSYGC
ncbi:hypothetical protein ACSQ67_010472 [Phaseolus vulgaris]